MTIKPLAKLTKTLSLLLKISILVSALAVITGLFEYYFYATLPAGLDPEETLLPSDIPVIIVGLAQTILFVILGIVFLRWIYQINMNLHLQTEKPMRFTPGWAVAYYFIPILLFFRPYQVMKEIWQRSHQQQPRSEDLLKWWWFLWIISVVASQLAFKSLMFADDTKSNMISSLLYVVSDGIEIILSIVALALVTQIWSAYSSNFGMVSSPLDSRG